MVKGKSNTKSRDIISLVLAIIIIILFNYLASLIFHRFDLTEEKRYSLTDATKNLLENTEDVLFVRVYLDGDLPPAFQKLRTATKEILDEFRAYGGDNIQYEFINPNESEDEKERVNIYKELTRQGLQYNNIRYEEGDKTAERIIFPGAIFSYKGKELPLQLLKSRLGQHEEVMINNSIQQLEYELSSMIHKMVNPYGKSVAFITGHGELEQFDIADAMNSLKEQYKVEPVELKGQLNALLGYNAIVIAGPKNKFSEKDKFIIDQFIMKGGKVLWLVENINATMDSLKTKSTTLSIPNMINLEDQLFKYGVRVNTDLVMDMQSRPIPIVTGFVGDQPKQDFFPWNYFPLIFPTSKHPIVTNSDAIMTEFVSSIDTVKAKGIKKTILLSSSKYTKKVMTPTRISLNTLREQPDEKQYQSAPAPIAVLLEGIFNSNFTNRIPKMITQNNDIGFLEKSIPTKMIVVSDADIIKNRYNTRTNEYQYMGWDKYTRKQYGNRAFFLNCMNYLLDDSGIIEARKKEFKIRLLDKQKIKSEKSQWQLINTVVPVILVVLFGMYKYQNRRKKYSVKNQNPSS